jgi:hypothetical protein
MGWAGLPCSRAQAEEDLANECAWLNELPPTSRAYQGTVDNITTLISRLEDPLPGED